MSRSVMAGRKADRREKTRKEQDPEERLTDRRLGSSSNCWDKARMPAVDEARQGWKAFYDSGEEGGEDECPSTS